MLSDVIFCTQLISRQISARIFSFQEKNGEKRQNATKTLAAPPVARNRKLAALANIMVARISMFLKCNSGLEIYLELYTIQ